MEKNNNFLTFLVSFLLALLLWGYAMNEGDNMVYKTIENIPISIVNNTEIDDYNLIATLSSSKVNNIKIYGKSSLVKGIDKKNVKADVDLQGINSTGKYSLNVDIKGIPSGVTVVSQTQEIIDIVVEYKMTKNISEVDIMKKGESPSGYNVLNTSYGDKNIHIVGPQSNVEDVVSVVGEVDISNKKETFSSEVKLYCVNREGKKVKNLKLSPNKINVDVEVGKTKEVEVKLKTKGNATDGYKVTNVTLEDKTVVISGSEEDLQGLETISTEVVDLSKVDSSGEMKAKLKLPEGIKAVGSEYVTLHVSVDKENEKTIYLTSFTFDNLKTTLGASVLDKDIKILLSGDEKNLAKITDKNIKAIVDVKDLEEGVHSVNLKISTQGIPNGVKIVKVNKNSVKVEIVKGNK